MSRDTKWVDARAIYENDNLMLAGTRVTNIRVNRLLWELCCYLGKRNGYSSASMYIQESVKRAMTEDGVLSKDGTVDPEHLENAKWFFDAIRQEKELANGKRKRRYNQNYRDRCAKK